MPAAAVIPAPGVSTVNVAVKGFVVVCAVYSFGSLCSRGGLGVCVTLAQPTRGIGQCGER